MTWENIVVSSKILGHISAGIYRSAGGALREMVSNAFDANATRVVITTNWPSFDVITCRDNGDGMTPEEFEQMMKGGIGESSKRLGDSVTPKLGRPVIGMLGIGMLGIAQVCHEFKMVSHHRETRTAFQATVRLVDYLREKVDAAAPIRAEGRELEVGQFEIQELEYDSEQAGTYVVAADMRSAFVRKFRESPGPSLPSKFSSFLDTIHDKRSVKELGDYWQMVWELTVACPIPYAEEGPFKWNRIKEPLEFQERFNGLKQSLKNYQFEVVVDGLPLRKPNLYPYPLTRRDERPMSGQLFAVDKEVQAYGRSLKLLGYIYMQDGQAVEPIELRGLLIRIRNVAIGAYDSTFLNYPKIEGPRFNWLSGEIYAEGGLEHALNIDRDSFNEMSEHFVKLQQTIHELLQEAFIKASQGIKERSLAKRAKEKSRKSKALQELLKRELGNNYELVETDDDQFPLRVDTRHKRVLISTRSPLWPRARSKRELAQLIGIAFEISRLVAEEERSDRFYKLLSEILEL